ncbi:hypothetical protein AU106_gp265 [Sinorhizobium phage phiM9]|uniref:Uncharacterized protein n=1 Tax=Sinorhizobium phage phiM9 TaxID=1636182 RepID=A0A0F6THC2_9CAUD|nr:hypothetical protein AU106_gp265 [Sinorhizobium phage phiM9]AKE44896.1 hypothetical protein Sm_phiM9_269 [Sinorhizobium phage phiM9]
MMKVMNLQEYLAFPTLDDLRAKGIRGAKLIGHPYRVDQWRVPGVYKIFERIKCDTCHAVTRIIDVDLI